MISKKKIVVVDYGVGNHESVVNALRYFNYPLEITENAAGIAKADALIIPGVGAFHEGMNNLKKRNFIAPLTDAALNHKKPVLGICLGMQMMADSSTEGGLCEGLGWIPGKVEKLDEAIFKRVPHVGWNNLCIKKKAPLFVQTDVDNDFYFDHSFYMNTAPLYQAATCIYEHGEITAAVQRNNIFGVQFHPEKSQNTGLRLFRSFLNFVDQYDPAVSYA